MGMVSLDSLPVWYNAADSIVLVIKGLIPAIVFLFLAY